MTIITQAGPTASDILIDSHNTDTHHVSYYSYGSIVSVVHIIGNPGCAASAATPPNRGVLNASKLEVYVEGNDGNLYNFERSLPGGTWILTQGTVNGLFTHSPSGHSGSIVYAVGHDGHLYDYYSGPNWGGPNNLAPPSGVSFVGSPSSFSYTVSGSSALHDIAFVVGSDGHLYSYEWVQGGGWTLTDLGNGVWTPFVGAPSAFAQ